MVLVERIRDGSVRLQDARVHREHPGAGQRMEVHGPIAVRFPFGQGQPEQTVRPFRPDSVEVEHRGQWVEVKVMMFQTPGRVFMEVVHHQAPANVGYVRERAVTLQWVHIHHQSGKPRGAVRAPQIRADDESTNHSVRVQVDYDQLRFAVSRAVRRSHVDHPQAVTHVHAQPERVDDLIDCPFPSDRQSVHRVVRVRH